MKKKVSVILIVIMLSMVFIVTPSAHGAIYSTSKAVNNKIKITLKLDEKLNGYGIKVTGYTLKNGKTLLISYELIKKQPAQQTFTYDLSGAIPPLRIVLQRTGDENYSLYSDIKGVEAEEYIRNLHDRGILTGDKTFRPSASLTRAEFAVIIVKSLGITGKAANDKGFKDIDKSWAKNYILLAVKNGLMSGSGNKVFGPDKPVTLAEVCAVTARAFKFHTTKNGIYSKLKQNAWYSQSVKKMFDAGILKETDSIWNNLNEEAPVSRADCAMIISRALSTY